MIYVSMQAQMVNTTGPTVSTARVEFRTHYDSYTFQGIQLLIHGRQNLVEYPYSGYDFCINVGVDQTTANSGIQCLH
jgi:hypothetical protein